MEDTPSDYGRDTIDWSRWGNSVYRLSPPAMRLTLDLRTRQGQVETIVQPGCVGNDVWWEPVPLVCIHGLILAAMAG